MELDILKNIVEALLIASEDGLTRDDLVKVVDEAGVKEIDDAVLALKEEYAGGNRGFLLVEIAGKLRISTKPEYNKWIIDLYKVEPDRLSGPSLEVLAVIAYKQPATRAEIEVVRGVNCGGVIKTLIDKELVKVKGRKDVIGKPLLYGTTEKFLEIFGLNKLDDLPMLRDFTAEDLDFDMKDPNLMIENDPENNGEQIAGGSSKDEKEEH